MSRKHYRLTLTPERLLVHDLGSANGTLLNGREIQSEELVPSGDRLQIGPVTLIVELSEPPNTSEELIPDVEVLLDGFELVE